MTEEKKKHPGGRPLKFKTPKELQKKIDEYFDSCFETVVDNRGQIVRDCQERPVKTQTRPFTITGLALHLGTTREILLHYETKEDRKEYSNSIKMAREKCHNYAEESLFIGKNPAGVIFNLKNNYGWRDKTEQEVDQNVKQELTITVQDYKTKEYLDNIIE